MTERHDIDDVDLTSLVDEDEFEEIYDGASTHAPGEMQGSPEIEQDATGAGNAVLNPGVITLRNMQSPEQSFGIHKNGKYTGKMVSFHEGVLITDRDTANQVLAASTQVFEEPTSGEIFEHPETKFKTRSPQVFAQYTMRRAQSQV